MTPRTEYLKIIFIYVYVCVPESVCYIYAAACESEESIGASVAGVDR